MTRVVHHHSEILVAIAKSLPFRNLYIELGIHEGVTHKRVSNLFEHSIGVDVDDRRGCCKEFFHGKTDAFFESHRVKELDGKSDLIFIDADHNSEQVSRDFTNCLELVKPVSGLIILHDTYPEDEGWLADDQCKDAWRAASHISNDSKYYEVEVVTLPVCHGLTICRKLPRGLPYLHWLEEKR